MSTLANVLSFSRAQAQTDSNGLTDTNGIIFANEALVDFRRRLQAEGIDAAQLQEAYRDGTAGTGTYLYPTDMAWLKAIELNYADTQASNYVVATQVDSSNIPANQSFSWLRGNAATNKPYFDDHGDWFEIFPTPTSAHNVSQLIRIIYYLEATEYTATSDTISYPESLDYRILGWRIAGSYNFSLDKFEEAQAFYDKYDERVRQLIATLGRGSQQPLQAVPIQEAGWNF